jgi:ribosomal protein L11 methyltransferase
MTTTHDSLPNDQQWLKISLFCPLQLLESAADLMGVLSGAGVEQSPETEAGATVSGFFQVHTATGETHPLGDNAAAILARVEQEMTGLFALYGYVPEQPAITLLADQDWATSWQQYFKPFAIVPGLVIKPSWEIYQPESGQHVIEMDPGMAFGTGQHASTRMALALIKQSMETIQPQRVLDVGTGTGILAMAAALFGAKQVLAIDNDPDAVTVALENIAKNRLTETIEVSTRPVAHIRGAYGLVTANIVHDVLVAIAPILAALTASGGHLVLAGILSGEQEENIARVYGDLGLQPTDRLYQDEWVALLLRKQGN